MEGIAVPLAKVKPIQEKSVHKVIQTIDRFIIDLEQCCSNIESSDNIQSEDLQFCLMSLGKNLTQKKYPDKIGDDRKDFRSSLAKLGKNIDKNCQPVQCNSWDYDKQLVNQAIAQHFCHEGKFELCSTFVKESKLEQSQFTPEPYARMHSILDNINKHDLSMVLEWINEEDYKKFLIERSSQLEFKIRQVQFLEILQSKGKLEAIKFSQEYFSKFSTNHMDELKELMVHLVKPQHNLSSVDNLYTSIGNLFVDDYCAYFKIPQHSQLYTSSIVGAMSLPGLNKLSNLKKLKNWSTLDKLPVEIELPPEFRFHSVFICPVSKEHTTETNPPMLLTCGHAISQASLQEISKYGTSRFKCPYCPVDQFAARAQTLYF